MHMSVCILKKLVHIFWNGQNLTASLSNKTCTHKIYTK